MTRRRVDEWKNRVAAPAEQPLEPMSYGERHDLAQLGKAGAYANLVQTLAGGRTHAKLESQPCEGRGQFFVVADDRVQMVREMLSELGLNAKRGKPGTSNALAFSHQQAIYLDSVQLLQRCESNGVDTSALITPERKADLLAALTTTPLPIVRLGPGAGENAEELKT